MLRIPFNALSAFFVPFKRQKPETAALSGLGLSYQRRLISAFNPSWITFGFIFFIIIFLLRACQVSRPFVRAVSSALFFTSEAFARVLPSRVALDIFFI